MIPKLATLASTLVLVAGCALAGGSPGGADPGGSGVPATPSLPTGGAASPSAPDPAPPAPALSSPAPGPIDDFGADLSAALSYLVATWGGEPSDYTLLESTFATVPGSGEKLWAAKFMDEPSTQIHEVYRDSSGAVGGLELWKAHFDPPLPTPRQGHWGPPIAGKPYTGADILNLLNFTPDPFGLPPVLRNAAATDLIAGTIWTYDGTRYDDLKVSGSCGERTCQVDVSGQRTDAAGGDTHSIVIELEDLTLRSAGHSLGAYPAALDPKLEDLCRQLVQPRILRGMRYRGAEWHLPPALDRYTLTFALDDTEGSPGKRVTLDLASRTLISIDDFTF